MKMNRSKDNLHKISKCYLSLDQNLFSNKNLCEQEQHQKVVNYFEMNQKKNSKLIARYKFNKKIFQKGHKNSSAHQSAQKIWLDFVQKTDETLIKKSKIKSFYDIYRQNLQQKRSAIKFNQTQIRNLQNSRKELENIQLRKQKIIKLKELNSKSKHIQSSYENNTNLCELSKKLSALNVKFNEFEQLQQNQQKLNKNQDRFSKLVNQKRFHTQGINQIQRQFEHKKEINISERSNKKDHLNLSKQKTILKVKKRKCKTINYQQNNTSCPNIQLNQKEKEMNKTKNLRFQLKKNQILNVHNKQEKKLNKSHFNILSNKEEGLQNLNSQGNPGKRLAHGYAFQALSQYQSKPELNHSLQYRIKSFKRKDSINRQLPLNNLQKNENTTTTEMKKQNKKVKLLSFKQKQLNMMNGSLSGWKSFSQKFDQPY